MNSASKHYFVIDNEYEVFKGCVLLDSMDCHQYRIPHWVSLEPIRDLTYNSNTRNLREYLSHVPLK